MIKFLLKPTTLLFITLYCGFIFWLLNRPSGSDFSWGNIYLQNFEGEAMGLGEASYHFNSKDDSYISYENMDFEKSGFYFKFSDGTSPRRLQFTDIKYNKIFRTLSAVCDFTKNGNDYLNVYYNQYIYENVKGHSRADGFQLDGDSYEDSLPFDLSVGAKLIIKARSNNSSDKIPTDLIISFDKLPHPRNESLYETEKIRLNNEINTYEISIPKLNSGSSIGSISMRVLNKNTALTIEETVLEYDKKGKKVSVELIFSDAFGEASLHEPFNDKDLKWVYKFKFNKDFSKIDNGKLVIHSMEYEPWTYGKYDSNWFYVKFDNGPTIGTDADGDVSSTNTEATGTGPIEPLGRDGDGSVNNADAINDKTNYSIVNANESKSHDYVITDQGQDSLKVKESFVNLPRLKDSIEINKKSFYVVLERLPWSDARYLAEELGGQLATFDDLSELLDIWNVIKIKFPKKTFWIGLSDENIEGAWEWIDGETLDNKFLTSTSSYMSRLEVDGDLNKRDYAHLMQRFGILSRPDNGSIPSFYRGRETVDGFIVEITNQGLSRN
jgi:hypothetical protein